MEYKKYFTLSFDDGLEQDKKIIEILKEFGLQATFNLNGGLFGTKKRLVHIGGLGFKEIQDRDGLAASITHAIPHYRIPEDEIAQVYRSFEIASHGFYHLPMATMTDQQRDEAIQADLDKLSAIAGCPIVGHAYCSIPVTPKDEACLARHGILYAREGTICTNSMDFPADPLDYMPSSWLVHYNLFERAELFLRLQPESRDLFFCAWGHGFEFDYNLPYSNWDRFKRFCEKMAGHSDIVYCTNREAFEDHARQLKNCSS